MKYVRGRKGYLDLFISGAMLAAVPALAAQPEQTTPDSSARRGTIEEVVVTARRREESLQDVPMAITAFSEERLYKEFAVDLRDFGPSIPNFQLEQVGLFQSAAAFSARGIGTAGIESFADPVVAVFVDGQYYPRNANALLDVFDLEAVEVMRGPQGTLYGQNAFAGAISVRTRRPSGERGTRLQTTFGNYGSRVFKGAVETPLVEGVLNGKLSLIHRDFDGYFTVRNLSGFSNDQLDAMVGEPVSENIGESAQGETKSVARLTLQWLPRDDMEVSLITTRSWNRGDGSPGINGYFEPGGGPGVFALLGFPGRDPFGDAHRDIPGDGSDPFYIGANHRDVNDQDLVNVVAEVIWDTDYGEWTTMASVQKVDSFITTDTDGELVDLFSSERQEEYESVQFETRFNTQPSPRSNLLAGLFVLRDKYDLYQRLLLGFGDPGDPTAEPPRAPIPTYRFPIDVRSPMHSVGQNGQKRLSVAPYVDFEYDLLPQLTLNLALRATWEEKTAFNNPNQVALGPPGVFIGEGEFDRVQFATECGTASESWFNVAPRVGLDYRPTENMLLFGFWQRAFKSGGLLNNSATCSAFLEAPYDEEQVDNFEVGMKSSFLEDRLILNVNAFYAKYKDLQRSMIRFAPNTPTRQESFTSNAAGAEIYGIEVASQALLFRGLTWYANVGWLDAQYDNFCADLDGPGAVPVGQEPVSPCGGSAELLAPGLALIDVDNSDREMTRAPEWDLSTRLVYEWTMGRLGYMSAEAAYSYTSELHTQVSNNIRTDRGALGRVDASVTWSDLSDRFRLSVWGKNLNDDVERLSRTEVANLFTFEFPTAPRTYGVTFSADF